METSRARQTWWFLCFLHKTFANLLFLLAVLLASAQQGTSDFGKAVDYLSQYGYLPSAINGKSSDSLITKEAFSEALSEFQRFTELNVTGTLNEETLQLMDSPRCGVKDKDEQFGRRRKRYVMQGSKWHKCNITYSIRKYPSANIKRIIIARIFQKAFDFWAKRTVLTFTRQTKGEADIDISFVTGKHGDNNPFDGRGKSLAHAYFPSFGGDAHFDDDENWSATGKSGTSLIQVAVHEFGHSLGLRHSEARVSIMSPIYTSTWTQLELTHDDIEGIVKLYGTQLITKKTTTTTTTTTPTTTTTKTPEATRSLLEKTLENQFPNVTDILAI